MRLVVKESWHFVSKGLLIVAECENCFYLNKFRFILLVVCTSVERNPQAFSFLILYFQENFAIIIDIAENTKATEQLVFLVSKQLKSKK